MTEIPAATQILQRTWSTRTNPGQNDANKKIPVQNFNVYLEHQDKLSVPNDQNSCGNPNFKVYLEHQDI